MTHSTSNVPRLLTLLVLGAGLVWAGFTIRYTLRAGWDSDIMRQWTVSRYLLERTNPWRLSYETLFLNYGTSHGPDRFRLKDLVIYEVHPNLKTDGIEGIRPDLGPPTATYPPSAELPISLTAGLLPRDAVLPVWLFVNLIALALLYRTLTSDKNGLPCDPPRSSNALFARGSVAVAALFLLWPPVHEVFRTSQFVFLVMLFLIAALRDMESRPWRSGVLLALALIKPSLTLPFLFIPLAKRRWIPFVVAGVLHLAGTILVSLWVREAPWVILKQWTEIPRYMLQGAYTIQEIINRAGFDNTATGQILTLLFVGACGAWCVWNRKASLASLTGFCVFFSLLWTYHERYDFALALIPIFTLFGPYRTGSRASGIPLVSALAYFTLGIALTDVVYGTDHAVFQVLRWLGRFSLVLLFVHAAVVLRSDAAKSAAT